MTNWGDLFFSPLSGQFNPATYSSDVFRYGTGGPSAQSLGLASSMANDNSGTYMANLARQNAERQGSNMYDRSVANAMAGGGGGNYNALAGIASSIAGGTAGSITDAYARGAQTNLASKEAAARLSSQNDTLAQKGRNDSLEYLARMRPDQISPENYKIQQGMQQGYDAYGQPIGTENWLAALGKGIAGGALTGLTGDLFGWLGQGIFGKDVKGATNLPGYRPDYGSGIYGGRSFGLGGMY